MHPSILIVNFTFSQIIKLRWITALCASLLVLPCAQATETINLYVGQAYVLNEPNVKRMALGNGKIVAATVLDARQVLLLPESVGQTTLYFWRKNNSENSYIINVVASDLNKLLVEIKAMLGDASTIKSRIVGDKVVLEGANVSSMESTRIAEIARRFPQIVNLVGRLGLEPMVYIDVQIVEFRKNALKSLGVKWDKGAPGFSVGVLGDFKRNGQFTPELNTTGAAPVPGIVSQPRINPFSAYVGIATSFASALNFAASNGDATILAEPKLTSKSGGVAKFHAGGEIPLPVTNSFGQTSVQFKPYGVRLDITPLVNDAGIISTKVTAELSAVDVANAVSGIPAFLTRRAETEVNLRENETLVLSGLMSEESGKAIDKVPSLGDIPILGALFRSTEFRRNQTELVIFLTPRIITPDATLNKALVESTREKIKGERTKGDGQLKLAE
jgi:pilus assembly protein CpaC